MTTTLLISTYNWPEALELVLLSVKTQSTLPNEIVIADDGSTQKTKLLIDHIAKNFPIPIYHIWHTDNGFQKAEILNKAISKTKSDYIIQIDGDVILHKKFIQNHIQFSKKNTYLFGSRVSIKKEYTFKVLQEKIIKFNWFNAGFLRRTRAIYFPIFNSFNTLDSVISRKLRGCNISYWKKDALTINGYNQDFIGWGFEDTNFAQRLLNSGVSSFRLKHAAIQYHIYHIEAPKGNTKIGNKIQTEAILKKTVQCKNGIINL